MPIEVRFAFYFEKKFEETSFHCSNAQSNSRKQAFLHQPSIVHKRIVVESKRTPSQASFSSLNTTEGKGDHKNSILVVRELHIDRHVFEDVVNAVADIPLQRRGRRPFIFSHRERILFLHTFLAFGLHIAHMLVLPRIKSSSEVNAIAKRIASQYCPESFVESVRSLQLPGLWPDLNF